MPDCSKRQAGLLTRAIPLRAFSMSSKKVPGVPDYASGISILHQPPSGWHHYRAETITAASMLPGQEITRENEGLFVRACVLRARARVRVFVCGPVCMCLQRRSCVRVAM
jgi:hypothetical protein